MDTDRSIQKAITSGERNKEVMELVRNWCQHARVRKVGGTGMIEQQTGLPIGHHTMACDHAPAGGMATWDLADAALDFHDRNCENCIHRIPVRLPNLTTLLKQRETGRGQAEREQQAWEQRISDLRAGRQETRQRLRAQLTPVSATIIDCLEDLDSEAPGDAATRLLGMAQLAPETFVPDVVEHCFGLIENREGWFDNMGLQLFKKLNADPTRLTRCAMQSLGAHRSVPLAAGIAQENSDVVDESLVADALPALIDLANPERTPFMGGERTLVPGPLITMHHAHRSATEVGIERLLSGRDPFLVSSGARAIEVLAERDKAIAPRFARALAAKLAGAKWLIDERETGYSGDDEVIQRLQAALVLALKHSPGDTDALIAQFLAGASGEGEVRLYHVYNLALHGSRRRSPEKPVANPAAKVALKRLIGAVNAVMSRNEAGTV
jgi:hypothetical protein